MPKDDDENPAPTAAVPIAEACAALSSGKSRATHGALEVSHGANATVYAYPLGSGQFAASDGARRELSDLVVKVGRWRSAKSFDMEVRMQRRAAMAGCAPLLFHAACQPVAAQSSASRGAVFGTIAMERLTQPTLYRWLHQVTREQRRKSGASNVGAWSISREALHEPVVKAWEREAKRLQAALVRAGVKHGDWHERNLVFDVPAARALTAVGRTPSPLEHHALRELIMQAIAQGPSGGAARMLVIDFEGSKPLGGMVDRFFASMCIDRHIVDPDEEPPSPLSRQASSNKRSPASGKGSAHGTSRTVTVAVRAPVRVSASAT